MIIVHHLNNSRSQRIHARPAYARALERGGKYDYAR
jgi:hypothetical protein